MEKNRRVITRRDFIRAGSCVAVAGLMGLPLAGPATAGPPLRSRVVLIRARRVLDGAGRLQAEILAKMLDDAVAALFEMQDPAGAWRKLAGPEDVVGIKSNAWEPLATPEPLEKAVERRLVAAGAKAENISLDDRGVRRNPVFRNATALVNMRPMRTHHWSGLGTLIKNYIVFAAQPWTYHGNACERLGAIWKRPEVKNKTRLNILVMLTPLFHGIGPHHFSRQYLWPYGGLIVSTDPVAADATGARIIQAKRNDYFGKYSPISPPPRHIEAADKTFQLGNSRPEKIDLVKLGWDEDALI